MAVSGRKTPSQLVDMCGSVSCFHCTKQGVKRQASEYCTDCCQDVCAECSICHHAPLFHDVDAWSTNGPLLYRKKPLIFESHLDDKLCEKHSENKMEFYCSSHDIIGCRVCMAVDHRTCSSIECIQNDSHTLKRKRDIDKLREKADTLHKDIKLFNTKLSIDIKGVTETYSIVLKTVIAYREKLIEHLDQLYTNIVKEAQKIRKEKYKVLNDLINENEVPRTDTENVRVLLDEMSSKESLCISFKKPEELLNSAELKLKKLYKTREDLSLGYRFVESSDTENLFSEWNTLGSLDSTLHYDYCESVDPEAHMSSSQEDGIKEQPDRQEYETNEHLFSQNPEDNNPSVEDENPSFQKSEHLDGQGSNDFEFNDKNIVYSEMINLKVANDSYGCGINDCLLLESDQLLVTDGFNYCVKLVDLYTSSVQSACYLAHSPDCVTALSVRQVVVTLPMRQSIQFLDVGDILTVSHELEVHGECRGIAYKEGKLAVTFKKPNRVVVMKTNGSVLHTVIAPDKNADLNISPSAIIFGRERDTLIMSDIYNDVVVKVDFNGKVLEFYGSDTLRLPLGLTMAEEGTILVCSQDSACVHSISDDLNTGKVILQNEDSVTNPVCVAFCSVTNKLYIFNFGPDGEETINNSVQVFQLL